MFVLKYFVRDCFVAQIRAKMCVRAGIRAYLRDEALKQRHAKQNPWLRPSTIGTISRNMLTNFELKRLKLKLDIVEKAENRVHKLTDSNVSLMIIPGPTRATYARLSLFTFLFSIFKAYTCKSGWCLNAIENMLSSDTSQKQLVLDWNLLSMLAI